MYSVLLLLLVKKLALLPFQVSLAPPFPHLLLLNVQNLLNLASVHSLPIVFQFSVILQLIEAALPVLGYKVVGGHQGNALPALDLVLQPLLRLPPVLLPHLIPIEPLPLLLRLGSPRLYFPLKPVKVPHLPLLLPSPALLFPIQLLPLLLPFFN